MFTEKDIQQIKNKGLTVKNVDDQVRDFIKGFPFLNISKPATLNDGIINLTQEGLFVSDDIMADLIII